MRLRATSRATSMPCTAPSRASTYTIKLPEGAGEACHELVLNYRGLKPVAIVAAQIEQLRAALGAGGVRWTAGADLASGEGAQQAEFVVGSNVPEGGAACPASFLPQQPRVPSLRSAQEKSSPEPTAEWFEPAGAPET